MNQKISVVLTVVVLILFLQLPSAFAKQNSNNIDAAIATLDRKISAWNKHDLAGVLDAYCDSTKTSFLTSSGSEIYGFHQLKQKYEQWYGKDKESMGKISYSALKTFSLGKEALLFCGEFILDEPNESHSEGLFSLVFTRTDRGWKILHEHLSSKKQP